MDTFAVVFLIWFATAVGVFIGWVINIIDLIHMQTFTGLAVMRIIGIFLAPLGAVLGYFA